MSRLKAKWAEPGFGSPDFKEEVPTGTVNGVNVTFTLSSVPLDMVSLTLNGRPLKPTIDYTRSGSTITMIVAPALGQELYAIYY